MALVIKCRKCGARMSLDQTACPACGSSDIRFIIDYWPRGRHGGRKQVTMPEQIADIAQARAIERSFMAARNARQAGDIEASPGSIVSELFPEYLVWYRLHRAELSWKDVAASWAHNLSAIFGSYPVGDISTEHFSLYQQIRSKQVSHRTVNKELDYFKGFLRWCRRDKHIELFRVEYESLPAKRPLPIVLSPDEISRILDAAQSEPLYHALIMCLYMLGLRISEARGLRRQDCDFQNALIRVLQKGGTWKILPINDRIIQALQKLETIQSSTRLKLPEGKRGSAAEAYVFSLRGDRPVQNIRGALKRICRRAGVTKKVNPHLFRHSIATHLMGADVNMRTIQQYLGHTQVTTTEFYTHVALEHLRGAQRIVTGK